MGFLTRTLGPLSLLASLAAATDFHVTVGKNGQLRFDPEEITAHPGDTVTYNYFAANHSVTESSFEEPCQPINNAIFSGFVPTASPDVASPTTFTIKIKDDKPIWIYCSQVNGNHCQNGMVHAINAPKKGNTFEKYKALAARSPPPSGSPPDGLPNGGVRKTVVQVGPDGMLIYRGNNLTEPARTVIEFQFNPANHTVTESSFENPCFPLVDKKGRQVGFSSGFVATQRSPSGAVFQIVVEDAKKPIWFYCGQVNGNHCQSGMVGAINAPPQGNNLEAFIALAARAPPPSVIPALAPLGGRFFINGIEIKKFPLNGGNAIDVDAFVAALPVKGNGRPKTMPSGGGDDEKYYDYDEKKYDDGDESEYMDEDKKYDDDYEYKGEDKKYGGGYKGGYGGGSKGSYTKKDTCEGDE